MVEEKEEVEIISKSEQKRRAKEVLVFAQKLASMTLKQMAKLDYPEELLEELKKVHKIKSAPAKARHIKYIAKLLRSYNESEQEKV